MESSRRDLLSDMAEHMTILKNIQNGYLNPNSLTPKTGSISQNADFVFFVNFKCPRSYPLPLFSTLHHRAEQSVRGQQKEVPNLSQHSLKAYVRHTVYQIRLRAACPTPLLLRSMTS